MYIHLFRIAFFLHLGENDIKEVDQMWKDLDKNQALRGTGITRGHLIPRGLLNKFSKKNGDQTVNYFNGYPQFAGVNLKQTIWETAIKDNFLENCIQTTKEIQSNVAISDVYVMTGVLPSIDQKLVKVNKKGEIFEDNGDDSPEDKNGIVIPYLQWTAMCCRVRLPSIGEQLARSFGYISMNRPFVGYDDIENRKKPDVFLLYPPDPNDVTKIYKMEKLKEALSSYQRKLQDPVNFESFFGRNNVCENEVNDQNRRVIIQELKRKEKRDAQKIGNIEKFFEQSFNPFTTTLKTSTAKSLKGVL